MNILPTLDDLLAQYQLAAQSLRNKGELTIEHGFNLVVTLYQEVKLRGVATNAAADDDMLLFQYGIRNMPDARGKHFVLDVTRQVIFEEDEEQLIYQLCFEFEFDAALFFGHCSYTSWSETSPSLTKWVTSQKATEGFILAQDVAFRNVNIELQQV